MPDAIPAFVVEYFLLGRTRRDAVEQYLQDGGVSTEVWLQFAAALDRPVRVIIAPNDGFTTVDVAHELALSLRQFRRRKGHTDRVRPSVSPLEDYITLNIYLDELLHVLLPRTRFYRSKGFQELSHKVLVRDFPLEEHLFHEIRARLGHEDFRGFASQQKGRERHWRVIEAAPLAALIGLFDAAGKDFIRMPDPATHDPRQPGASDAFNAWVYHNAETIAHHAVSALQEAQSSTETEAPRPENALDRSRRDVPDFGAEGLIRRIFLDRRARPASSEAICTVKADAAQLLFDISCKHITWAIIDTGIAALHPAFLDQDHAARHGQRIDGRSSRVRASFDLTLVDRIRNYDLVEDEEGSPEARDAIEELIGMLEALPVRRPDFGRPFRRVARESLRQIAGQLRRRLKPHWQLIEPLITILPDEGEHLLSDHGTHVAGTLGAHWVDEDQPDRAVLKGMCPDINLYDLRVIPSTNLGGDLSTTESAVLAALEFVQHLNSRAMAGTQIIHGVNISLSIPHDVRNYGCGATPICVACDRLVGSGVAVVAAAGNRGWNEQEMGFGTFVFCSITDPGNAREVITVGSTHRMKPHIYGVSYFSSRGPTGDGRIKPDLVAPGEAIKGPIRGGAETELSGTSMAAPYVSGAAAMLMARHPEMIGRPREVKEALCDNATDLHRERYFQGHGLLDVLRAIQSR